MKTYEDLLKIQGESDKQEFILSAIIEHKSSKLYTNAVDAYNYYRRKNTTILAYQKMLYNLAGEAVPDNFSANYKFCNNFFQIFVKQEVSYLLGNGVTFGEEGTKDSLGGAQFDNQLYKAGTYALWGAVSFGFYNLDHIDVFKVTEFVPLFGEEDGALHAGIRFWQIDRNKPLRVTLYEEDGYTEYVYNRTDDTVVGRILSPKRPYVIQYQASDTDMQILDGRNYPKFPIVPLWANDERQTELEGIREKIDGYDLIQSGLANDLDEASHIYWVIKNAGGMDDIDLAKFIERLKVVKATTVDENGSTAEAHTLEVPYQARKEGLIELRDSLYRDAMALDTDKISAGQITATAIRASYENIDLKCDGFEMCVTDFIKGILELAGIDDNPTYKRTRIVNVQEETQVVLSSAQYLDDETILKHLPFISPDEIEKILDNRVKEEASRYEQYNDEEDTTIEEEREE